MEKEVIEGYRLSPQQRHLWRLLRQDAAPYRSTLALVASGSVDADALARAVRLAVERHEVLRTSFAQAPGMATAVQVIEEEARVEVAERKPGEGESVEEAVRREAEALGVSAEGGAPSAVLVSAGDGGSGGGEVGLAVAVSAMQADERGMRNLFAELVSCYEAEAGGVEAEGEVAQYADLSEPLNELLESEETAAGREYWRRLEVGNGAELGLEGTGENDGGFHPERVCAEYARWGELEGAARAMGVGLEAMLLGCWQVLLGRLSGRERVVTGVVLDGRNYEELRGAVGLLARTLPLPSDLSPSSRFTDLAASLSASLAEAHDLQDYFSWDSAPREEGHEPYWSYAFEYREAEQPLRAAGVEFRLVASDSCPDRFRLKLGATRSGSSLRLSFHYDSSHFECARVRRLASQYTRLLDSLLARPSASLAELDVTSREDEELVERFNRTEADFGEASCLHTLVERQAATTPDATAVEWESGSLTYRELDERANRLARHLLSTGVSRESLVAVHMERSPELVVALLGVLKAGCAYVPVDPSYPSQRVELMLNDSGAQVVLTQGRLARGLGAAGGLRVITVDDGWDDIARHGGEAPVVGVSPDQLAYVIYTSGSTGTPKGVAVSHRSITNRLLWVLTEHPLDSSDAVLQKTPVSFDASVWELFAPLMAGARLVLARPGGQQDPAYLLEAVRHHRVTILQVVPTMLGALTGLEGRDGLGSCESLRRVYSGGEALRPELVERFYERVAGLPVRLHNLYGPTECSIDATHLAMEPGARESRVLIGRPLGNTRVYVLDALWRHCPVGVSGELYVSGVQLARGYLRRPGLTAERFLPDPFAQRPGARMYRTGDVGRYTEAGVVEYLGRGDYQVKLRGYRIELGEVEAAALSCPGVRQAAALLVEGEGGGGARLSLYVTGAQGTNGDRAHAGGDGVHADGDGAHADGGGEEVELPDGLRVLVANRQEATVLYHEIYETGGHLGSGIELSDGDTVFDVGANAGLFTLYLCDRWRGLRVHAFEPVPAVFSLLERNVGRYGLDVRLHRAGLWRESGVLRMTYYPRWSSMSGAYGDEAEERELTRRVLARRGGEAAAHAEELMEGRFEAVEVECRVRTLSEVVAEEGIERIDLLKVDVEKSEEEVLAGIKDEDWAKVRQLVLEVHDSGGRLGRIEGLLRGRGYEVRSEQEGWLEGTGLFNLYAVSREVVEERERKAARGADGGAEAGEAERPGGLLRREMKVNGVEVRRHLSARLPEYMVPAQVVVLAGMPLTPSGKVDRRALPAMAAQAERGGYEAPRDAREEELCRIWGEVLRAERVGVRDNFFELGGDSILSLQVIARAARAGMRLTPTQLFQHQTISELAKVVEERDEEIGDQGVATGEAALTPIQERFLREQPEGALDHYNQSLLLEAGDGVDERALGEALRLVVEHHDALRARYKRDEDGRWRQSIGAPDETDEGSPLTVVDLTEVEDFKGGVEAAADQLQRSLSLREGPLLRAALLRTSDGGRLLLAAHHLVVDGVSWRVLLDDLQSAYSRLAEGEEVSLPAKTTPYRRWAEALREYARSEAVSAQADYWMGRAEAGSLSVEAEYAGGENTAEWARGLTVELEESDTTRLLKQAPEVYHTQINDLLLTALARSLCSWIGGGAGEVSKVKVDLEGHGRREEVAAGLDLTRTVGWFTSLFPVLLEVSAGEAPSETLKRVKEELRAVPDQGLGYGALRYLRDDEVSRRLEEAGDSIVAFNYLGQTDAVLRDGEGGLALKPARESAGANASERSVRAHLIDVNALVSGGRLRVSFTYLSHLLGEGRVRQLADSYIGELRRLVSHLLTEAEGGHTPSDFPQAAVTQEKLDELWRRGVRPEAVYGLSPLQEGLLFHSLYEGGGELYVVQLSYRLEGELDEAALRRAWAEAGRRHEALRTGYEWEGVEPMAAVVRREPELRWERLDWSGLSEAEQEARLGEYLEGERRRGFDVRESPLTRQAVIALGGGAHQFVWTFHHLIMDGWCMPIITREVIELYEAYAEGREPKLEPAPRYRDYVAWLRRQDMSAAESYWRGRLAGMESPTPLGRLLASGGEEGGGYSKRERVLSGELTGRLEGLARGWQVTLNTLVQGAWALLLGRASGRGEVVYGVTVSGRPAELEGVERMVGLFINTLPARVRIEEGAAVEGWLRGMQAEAVRMREYEYSPLSQVQAWSEMQRGVQLFDSILVYENFPVGESLKEWKGDLQIRSVKYALAPPHYPIAVAVIPGPELMLRIFFDRSRVNEKSVETTLWHFESLLQLMAANPGATVARLDEALTEAIKQEETRRREERKEARREKLKKIERRPAGSLTE